MNALKEYLLLIVISFFLAQHVGTVYGELSNNLLSAVALKLEQVRTLAR